MSKEKAWSTFKNTGNVDAYLMMKELEKQEMQSSFKLDMTSINPIQNLNDNRQEL